MSQEVSRRGFLGGLTAGGGLLAAGVESAAGRKPADAVVHPVHPLFEPSPSAGRVRVLLTVKLAPEEIERLRQAAPNADLVTSRDPKVKAAAADAEVILGEPDVEMVLAAKRLKWVQHWAAGVERLPRELMEHPCVLSNMQRVFAPVIAATVFAMLLSLTRGLAQDAVPNIRLRKWARASTVPLEDLYQKTMGVVGLGGIGTEVSRRAHPLGVPKLVITPHNADAAPVRQVRLVALVAENLRRYCSGLPLLNVVDKAKGY